jgi:hypothetical protein
VSLTSFQNEDNVDELEKLRSHHESSAKVVIDLSEHLEDSLKKLHDVNHHHKEKSSDVRKKSNQKVIINNLIKFV